jgi:hypothetical protein
MTKRIVEAFRATQKVFAEKELIDLTVTMG